MNKNEIREKIKNTKLKTEKLYIPDWDSDVYIHEMNGKQYMNISTISVENGEINQEKFITLSIIHTTYDVNGENIFTKDDFETVSNLSADIYSQLSTIIMQINNVNGASKAKN
jgi:hypothetical protein